MFKYLPLLLIPFTLFAKPVDLTGRILSNDLTPIAGAIVSLENQDITDTTDSEGNYHLVGNTTAAITTANQKQASIALHGDQVAVHLTKAGTVTISLFNTQGRSVIPAQTHILHSGSHRLSPFQDASIASGMYIVKITTDNKQLTTRYIPGGQAVNATIVNSSAHAAVSREAENYSLNVTKSGQKVLQIPLTSLTAKLSDLLLVQRNISGSLTGNSTNIGKIEFVLTGESVVDTITKEVWFNQAISGYSGFLFMQYSEQSQSFDITINVYDTGDKLCGRSQSINFNQLAGDILIPSFNANNGIITQQLSGPNKVVVGTSVEFTRTFKTPFSTPLSFQWDDKRSEGWDDSLTVNTPFQVTYLETGSFEIASCITDDLGRSSIVTHPITVIDSIKKWDGTGAAPITLNDLQALILTSEFYNPDYRPTLADGPGARYGKLSAGLYDTWKGETQLQIVLPTDTFELHNNKYVFSTEYTPNLHYWKNLALVQEIFSFDMQLFTALGATRTHTGLNQDNSSTVDLKEIGVRGPFEFEFMSFFVQASGYPKFYPTLDLSTMDYKSFSTFSYGDDFTMSSPHMGNAIIGAGLCLNHHYDILHYATDIFWDEALTNGIDRNLGSAFLMAMYNMGSHGFLSENAAKLNSANWQSTAQITPIIEEPMFTEKPFVGDLHRIYSLLSAASSASLTDPTLAILDAPLSKNELLTLYFGVGGSANNLGTGGILQHIALTKGELESVYTTLELAFDMCKGKAPSTVGTENISMRYDLLSVSRTVKNFFDVRREKTISTEAKNIIDMFSKGE